MKELIESVKVLVQEEGTRSMIEHPLFNSTHEGYAVIKEEVEESTDELKYINEELNSIWHHTKNNRQDMALNHMKSLRADAINMAAESIQVAAMAQKFIDSFKEDVNE